MVVEDVTGNVVSSDSSSSSEEVVGYGVVGVVDGQGNSVVVVGPDGIGDDDFGVVVGEGTIGPPSDGTIPTTFDGPPFE